MINKKLFKLVWARLKVFLTWPSVTVEYPSVYRQPTHGSRVGLRNNFSECIGCHECEKKCPVQCIAITSEVYLASAKRPVTSKGLAFEKKVTSFKIDYNQCIQCGICVDVCPPESLSYDKNFVVPRQKNQHLILDLVHRPRSLRIEQGFEE